LETVLQISNGQIKAKSQDNGPDSTLPLKSAPKIFKEDCRINWNLPGKEIFNLIRGLSPSPGAFTSLEREEGGVLLFKIFSTSFASAPQGEIPGTISTDGKRTLKVAVKDGTLEILTIQQEGKRKMDVKDFLAGFSLRNGEHRFS